MLLEVIFSSGVASCYYAVCFFEKLIQGGEVEDKWFNGCRSCLLETVIELRGYIHCRRGELLTRKCRQLDCG
jgi:hypothetical protein